MNIAAIADVHSPKYLDKYERALQNISSSNIEALFFAGDMIYKGKWKEFDKVLRITKQYVKKPIYACFGNEEYEETINHLVETYPEITWLNDNFILLKTSFGKELFIVGTKGVLDRPTRWQRKHIPNIEKLYAERINKIKELLMLGRKESYTVILLTHYPPTYKTLWGEPRYAWPEMGSARMEKVILETKPNIIIHGHAHNSKKNQVRMGTIRIYNVSFPATKKITLIPLRSSLLEFFQREH